MKYAATIAIAKSKIPGIETEGTDAPWAVAQAEN